MQFKPESDIVFSYQPNKHLASFLTIKNISSSPYMFKFKASNPTKISIKPSPHHLKPNQQVKVHIAVHREAVTNISSEKIQIVFGSKEYSQQKNFNLVLQNGNKNDMLNLTVMVHEKETRVSQLEHQINEFKLMPKKSEEGQKSNSKITYSIIAIIGLILGYFSPLNVFTL